MIDSKLARFQTIIPKRIALAPITKCAFSYFCHIGRPLLPFVDGMVYSVVNAWAKLRAFFDNSNITPFFFRILRPSAVFRMSRARTLFIFIGFCPSVVRSVFLCQWFFPVGGESCDIMIMGALVVFLLTTPLTPFLRGDKGGAYKVECGRGKLRKERGCISL